MSKVYVLINHEPESCPEVFRIVTNKKAADYVNSDEFHYFIEFELNDPELLNRIAKESENKK